MNPWVFVGIHPLERYNAIKKLKSLDSSLEGILEASSFVFGVTKEQMLGKSRAHLIVLARHAFCKIADLYCFSTRTAIGEHLNRHHATAIHSIKTASNMLDTYPEFKKKYLELEDVILYTKLQKEKEKEKPSNSIKNEGILLQPG